MTNFVSENMTVNSEKKRFCWVTYKSSYSHIYASRKSNETNGFWNGLILESHQVIWRNLHQSSVIRKKAFVCGKKKHFGPKKIRE